MEGARTLEGLEIMASPPERRPTLPAERPLTTRIAEGPVQGTPPSAATRTLSRMIAGLGEGLDPMSYARILEG